MTLLPLRLQEGAAKLGYGCILLQDYSKSIHPTWKHHWDFQGHYWPFVLLFLVWEAWAISPLGRTLVWTDQKDKPIAIVETDFESQLSIGKCSKSDIMDSEKDMV